MDVITTHINADFDTIASMVAARKLYPDAVLVVPGSKEETVKGFLLQSAFYALSMRKAKEIDLSRVTRLVLVDIRNSSRIGVFRELIGRPGVEIHVYDHHPEEDSDIRGDVEVVRKTGSTTTILVGILKEKGISIAPDEATLMLLGIYEDTGSLIYPSTTVDDYLAAAHLLSCGGNLAAVADILARDLTVGQIALLHDFIQGSRTYTIHGVEVVIAEARREEYVGDIAVLVHKLRDMQSVSVLFALCQMGDRVVLIGRSRRHEVDAGAVMREFGGGGHSYAASANVRDATLIQVRERILHVLAEKIIPRRAVRDIMAHPVRSVDEGETLDAVHRLFTRFNLNAAPVVSGDEATGILTRQVVEKALYHGLGAETAGEYMNTEFEAVAADDGIERLQEIILGKNQRLVPVVDGGKLAGIVTRTGFLRFLHDIREIKEPGTDEEIPPEGFATRRKNVRNLMLERLPPRVLGMLETAGAVAAQVGMEAYVVGGFVRDLLMRIENLDVDIVVEGDGIAFAESFAAQAGCRVRAHHKFGTAVLVFPDGFKVDVATARVEYYVEPAALPTVEFSSLRQDLYRRDFTINTLAVRLSTDRFGELIDFFGAQQDIKERSIRVLHSLSFVEDPTRILRALRFEQRFGFAIARHTLHLIRNAVRLDLIGRLPKPRLFAELNLILREKEPPGIFRRLAELGLGPSLHPRITLDREHLPLLGEALDVLSWYSLLYLDEPVDRAGVLFLALLDPLPADEAKAFTGALGAGRHLRRLVAAQKDSGDGVVRRLLTAPSVSRKMIHDVLSEIPVEVVLHVMARTRHPDIRRYISLYFTQLRKVRPCLTGKDLRGLGYPPGPVYRRILDGIHERQLAGDLRTREEEISYVLSRFPR